MRLLNLLRCCRGCWCAGCYCCAAGSAGARTWLPCVGCALAVALALGTSTSTTRSVAITVAALRLAPPLGRRPTAFIVASIEVVVRLVVVHASRVLVIVLVVIVSHQIDVHVRGGASAAAAASASAPAWLRALFGAVGHSL
jgi:hypothetical protein